MLRLAIYSIICLFAAVASWGANPMATNFTYEECQGSLRPYPQPAPVATPDSLQAVMINHVGRHGARYPASSKNCATMRQALMRADSARTLTPLGRKLIGIVDAVAIASQGRWGALDSLGEAEQRGIASRMYANFPALMKEAQVQAMSSYSPRAMMSMYCFTHQLCRLSNRMEFATTTGRQNDALLRPFDVDQDYLDFRASEAWAPAYDAYFEAFCPITAIDRVLGAGYPYTSDAERRELAITEYYVLAGLQAMSMPSPLSDFFTLPEINALWSCFNLRQYLQRTATTVSIVPAEIASDLLLSMIETTDAMVAGAGGAPVVLRFGHAETLMPLLSLMRMPGCYYMTNYFDTVAQHWQDFYVVPMAANLQMILFKTEKGKYYVRFDLNEKPVALIPNTDAIYIPWSQAREFLMRCIPLHKQI